jgi:hypothetical protein
MDLRKAVISVVVSGLFVLSILSWVILTQTQNNTEYLITNNTVINSTYSNLYGNISAAQTQADTAFVPYAGNTTPTTSYGIADINLIVSPTRIFTALTLGTFNVIVVLPSKFLGVPPIVIGIAEAILLLIIILGGWALIRGISY